eukprot:jgi/Bigna1/90717/estExt_fgenesh1_pg.C_770088
MSVGTVYRSTVSPLYKSLHGEEDLTSNTMLLRMAYCLMWATISIFNLWVLYKNSTHVYASFLWDSSTVRMKIMISELNASCFAIALVVPSFENFQAGCRNGNSQEFPYKLSKEIGKPNEGYGQAMKMIHAPMPLDKLVEKNFDAKSIFTESCGAQALDAKAR